MFNPSRLTLARQRRGLTKADLAQQTKTTVRGISAFESGITVPSYDTVAELACILRFPKEFFSAATLDIPLAECASSHALSLITASERDSMLAAAALAIGFSKWTDARHSCKTKMDAGNAYIHKKIGRQ